MGGIIMANELPQGFTLDNKAQALPQGFTVDQPSEVQDDLSATEQIVGGVSGAATLASDIGGTIVGGLTALVDVMNPFTDNDPTQMIQRIQDKLRIDPTVGGEAALNQMGEIIKSSGAGSLIKSVKDFSDKAGQEGLDITGSPAFATFVNIIPDIIAEVGGAGLGKRLAKSSVISPVTSQAKK